MQTLAAALGVLMMLVSLWVAARPAQLQAVGREVLDSRLRYVAALVRLLFGVVLLAAAPVSRYPLVFEVLGWLFVLGGLLLVVFPPNLIAWFINLVERVPAWLIRSLSPLVFLFGAFVFYSFT